MPSDPDAGGLKSELAPGNKPGSIIMKGAGFYGVPPARTGQEPSGSILRKQVAELCVAGTCMTDAFTLAAWNHTAARNALTRVPLSRRPSDMQASQPPCRHLSPITVQPW